MKGTEFVELCKDLLRAGVDYPDFPKPFHIELDYEVFHNQDVGKLALTIPNVDVLVAGIAYVKTNRNIRTVTESFEHKIFQLRIGLKDIEPEDVKELCESLRKDIVFLCSRVK